MAFKKYLNKQDKEDLYIFTFFLDKLEGIKDNWHDRGNMRKEEYRDLSKALELGLKAYKSIFDRLDNDARLSFIKALESRKVYVDLPHVIESLNKKRECDLKGVYETNIEWLTLIELAMDRACLNCKTKCGDCNLFKYFEARYIPSFYVEGEEMAKEHKNCKYAYDLDFLNEVKEKLDKQKGDSANGNKANIRSPRKAK